MDHELRLEALEKRGGIERVINTHNAYENAEEKGHHIRSGHNLGPGANLIAQQQAHNQQGMSEQDTKKLTKDLLMYMLPKQVRVEIIQRM